MQTEKITQIEISDLEDDKVFFTSIPQKRTTKKTAISVEQYNEDGDIQLATIAHGQNFINLEDDYNDDDDELA